MSMMLEGAVAVRSLHWSSDFVVVEGGEPGIEALKRIRLSGKRWVIVSRHSAQYLYAFTADELLKTYFSSRLASQGHYPPIEDALEMREDDSSTTTTDRSAPPAIDMSWRHEPRGLAVTRWIEIGADGSPLAVGAEAPKADEPMAEVERVPTGGRRRGMSAPPMPPPSAPAPASRGQRSKPPLSGGEGSFSMAAPETDEGVRPVRYPSINADAAMEPGKRVTISVELLQQRSAHTEGGPLAISALPEDWKSLDISVSLSSAAIDFEAEGTGKLTIKRNAAGMAAHIKGVVRAHLNPGDKIEISAVFFHGARFCGSALRAFVAGVLGSTDAANTSDPGITGSGGVVFEPGATQPDLTVYIERLDDARPNLLRWRVIPREKFPGLPAALREDIDLKEPPAQTAFKLFSKFPALVPGQHRESIEGFGDELWGKTPIMFRRVYWALVAHYKRTLTIQLVSDEPHLPWELMRPATDDDSTVHKPLALQQVVARWIDRYEGKMSNALPGGSLVSIAPKYASARLALPEAQVETEKLISTLGARRVDGTRAEILKLLRDENPDPTIGVLHFAGHGAFAADVAAASHIKLENGETLTSLEVKNKDVRLGDKCRTLVFFNACEVGATGKVFGEVGGWADAFLARQFGAFIAPLWAVEEKDSAIVAQDLLDRIYKQRAPIGEALREIRVKYADRSPTFYSYLYYGDVTARLSA